MKRRKNNMNIGRRVSFCRIPVMLVFLLLTACSEAPVGQTPTDSTAPKPLTNVDIVPTNGGARITYTLPADEVDISYVKCEYTYKGEQFSVIRSIYSDNLVIEGLGDTNELEIRLYLVDHSENKSEPVIRTFIPLDPPLVAIYNSFKFEPSFGGVNITWENPAQYNAIITVFAANDAGELEIKDMAFTSLKADSRTIRGYNPPAHVFAACVADRWGNSSDTLKVLETPVYEIQLDKANFYEMQLQGDNTTDRGSRPLKNVWDGDLNTLWHTDPEAGSKPNYFSIDLGASAKLTRMMLWNRYDYPFWQHNLRLFEVWGTNELKYDWHDAAGRTDPYWADASPVTGWRKDWTLLGDFEVIKPSGLPAKEGAVTEEDKAAERAGFEFIFVQTAGPVRYLRFVVKKTWMDTTAIHFNELSIFGDER
ncbi:MAG: DUF4959 domain-containing protein [Bacteroidales bacterium]|jgi:hypothetical protein|nr:DUF4959 domain-containing protein [Bacteroidales bacterium]